MSEATLQATVATALRALSDFADADVTVNDWSILDQSTTRAPYAIIETADAFQYLGAITPLVWSIPVNLFVAFSDWTQAKNDMRDLRQSVIATLAGQCDTSNIRADGRISEWYDQYADAKSAEPVYLSQRIIFEIRG